MRIGFSYIVIVFIVFSCTGDYSAKKYINWVKDINNGLRVHREIGQYYVEVQYQPIDFLLIEQVKNFGGHPDSLRMEIDGLQYCYLTIGATDKQIDFIQHNTNTDIDGQQKLYYFSYLFQQDIYWVEGGKKYPCVLFHFERSYDLKKSRGFSLGFEKPITESGNATLVIESEYLSEEPIEIIINKSNIPKVRI